MTKIHAFRAHLPWRTERFTERGRPANARTVDYAELGTIAADHRAAGGWAARPHCVVCLDMGRVHPRTYGSNPTAVMMREIDREDAKGGRLTSDFSPRRN